MGAAKPEPLSISLHVNPSAGDGLDPACELTGHRRYIEAGMRSVEALLDSSAYRSPVSEAKPYAMVYRTFINFLRPAAELGFLKPFGYRY